MECRGESEDTSWSYEKVARMVNLLLDRFRGERERENEPQSTRLSLLSAFSYFSFSLLSSTFSSFQLKRN